MSVIPADSTGTYPALTGYTPMLLGRRIGIAVVDVVIVYAVYFLSVFVMIQTGTDVGAFLGMGLMLALVVVELWALFAKSARLSGVFMNALYVDVQTGLPAPGKIILKALLQSLISFVSCGIAPLIIVLASVQPPLQRNWFDRTVGLMLVDARTGRQPGGPVQVQPAPAYTPQPAYGLPPEPVFTPPPPVPEPPMPDPVFRYAQPLDAGVPFALPAEPDYHYDQPPTSGLDYPSPAVIQGVPGVDPSVDHTRPASFSVHRQPVVAQLDDGTPLSLDPPTVLGRNPQAPASYPAALILPVADPSMETSKTHLIVGAENSGAWVIDLHSANGVYISAPGISDPERLIPGERRVLTSGATIRFGSRRIQLS
mgnify:CR=1 FL=1